MIFKKKRLIVLAVILMFSFTGGLATAQSDLQKAVISLKGVDALYVKVSTWMKDDFGYRRLNVIHESVLTLTDVFVQDFLSTNR